jgi:hypothetical protein
LEIDAAKIGAKTGQPRLGAFSTVRDGCFFEDDATPGLLALVV